MAGGEMPLDYMLRVMRDKDADPSRRDEMAKASSPYLHPKLAVQETEHTPVGPVTIIWEGMPRPATAAVDTAEQLLLTHDPATDGETVQ